MSNYVPDYGVLSIAWVASNVYGNGTVTYDSVSIVVYNSAAVVSGHDTGVTSTESYVFG